LRADASPQAGTGHVRRCLALAAALREAGADVRLVARALGVDAAALAAGAGVACIELPAAEAPLDTADPVPHAAWAGVRWDDDAEQTAQALATWQPSTIVVDHYAFDARWHRAVAERNVARLAAIDDLADRALDVDWLIDHNLNRDHREKYRGRTGSRTTLLGGPRFALLGPAYAALQPLQVESEVASVGIFMGGVDAANLSALALRACREHAGFTGAIEIAVTGANPHLQPLQELASQWPATRIVCDAPDLASFFTRHGVQIGAGGGAAWERCCAGAPTLALIAAPNQQAVVPALAALGAVATLAPNEPVSAETVGRAVASLLTDAARRRELGLRSRALVDGLGARRVALALCAGRLALRAAGAADAPRTFAWRNDPAIRRVSRDPRELRRAEHETWWQRALADPRRRLFVAHVGRIDVGVLRFDFDHGGREAEVSIYLDPALTGLGLGPAVLRAGQLWARQAGGLQRLVAHVQPDNTASRRAFAGVGFVPATPADWTWTIAP
jgi:UDP-2,4-diacetamido-2,4,6-trideoxy-beta-L-altropyranose hydrolase